MDELRDALIPLTEEEGAKLFKNVWEARDGYIDVILHRDEAAEKRFFAAHQKQTLSDADRVLALKLMEMQRHTQLMYTSCGWFFDDISGIETVQVIAYAARVLQLAGELFGDRAAALEPAFVAQLKEAGSNVAKAGDGAQIYNNVIGPMKLGLEQVAAHYAISSLFPLTPTRSSFTAIASNASRGTSSLPAAASSPSAARISQALLPMRRRTSALPFFTSATRTSPRQSRPTPPGR